MAEISIVIPVKDEAGNAAPLAREIAEAMGGLGQDPGNKQPSYEIIFVDDGSSDGTSAELVSLRSDLPMIRILVHARSFGQSRALRSGVLAASGEIIISLDGDGQNIPADIPKLLEAFANAPARLGMVAGERAKRKDSWSKRAASRLANGLRRWVLDDKAKDVGCGLKLFRRAAFLELPYFDHMHRYLIALMQREGYEVRFVPVGHRPRQAGRSKYGNWDRFVVGISDLLGVIWLKRRFRGPTETKEI
ncbi:MAG: glycosyltransferase family 2 protein [Micropepsaceae bacterium]